MNNSMTLARWLEWFQADADSKGERFNQVVLEERSGVKQTYISQLLTGRRNLGDRVLTKLCTGMGITKAEFFSGPPPASALASRMVFVDGITLRNRRLKRGLSVSQLAGMTGKTIHMIEDLESAVEKEADAGFIAQLADALDVMPRDLERRRLDISLDGLSSDTLEVCNLCSGENRNNTTGVCVHCGQKLVAKNKIVLWIPRGQKKSSDQQVRVEKAFTLPDGAEFDTEDMMRMKAVKLLCEMKGGDLERVVAYIEGIHAARDAEKKRSTA